jgi:hypothetical protein
MSRLHWRRAVAAMQPASFNKARRTVGMPKWRAAVGEDGHCVFVTL